MRRERRFMGELRRSSAENSYLFGIAMGLAGLGASLGLASELHTWSGVMWHPGNWSLPILGLSLAVVQYYYVKYRREYERSRRTSYIAIGVGMAGSIGVAVSNWFRRFPSIDWIIWVWVGLFSVGVIIGIVLCLSPIRDRIVSCLLRIREMREKRGKQ